MDETPSKPWYVAFFEGDYRYLYENQPGVSADRTRLQLDFIERTLALPQGAQVLDLCCGWGRHAIPLAQRGFKVTGLDLSVSHLGLAARDAARASVRLDLVRSDMRVIPFTERFDVAINLFTAWGYFETEQEDQKVLDAISGALKPGGRFLIDLINRDYLMRNYISKDWELLQDGVLVLYARSFNPVTSRNDVRMILVQPDGTRRETGHSLRVYTLTELIEMLKTAGLQFRQVWGGFDGSPFTLEKNRMIVLTQKP